MRTNLSVLLVYFQETPDAYCCRIQKILPEKIVSWLLFIQAGLLTFNSEVK